MSETRQLAHAPDREDLSVNVRKSSRTLAVAPHCRASVAAVLVLSVACSRVSPSPKTEGQVTRSEREVALDGRPVTPGESARRDAVDEKAEEKKDQSAGYAYDMAEEPMAPPPAPAKAGAAPAATAGPLDELVPSGPAASAYGVAAPTTAAPAMKRAAHARGSSPKAMRATGSAGIGGGGLALQVGGALAPTPQPEFNTEGYSSVHDNPFKLVTEAPLSTFSVDVDTASYSNMRRFVTEGHLPPRDAIRVEEWINYFGYDDASPAKGEPVGLSTEVTACPWNASHELLRVALTTEPIPQDKVPPRNLVFLVDVSGSMEPANKLPLLKRGLAMLARQLRPIDTLSIVVYAGASGLALPPTSGAEQGKILASLGGLESGGSTNGAEGIELAYRLAQSQMKPGGINRVILATDGDFNVGVTSEGELTRLIEEKRKSGVFLTVLGFGEGNVKDSTMEMLADKGNGNYAYVDTLDEARKVLVREAGATLVTVAQDVKLQLEFNPSHVKGYRLVGYEDRVLADQDFNDDKKDAGDLGAGHHVTAFYEIVPAGAASPIAAPPVDPLKYQTARGPAAPAESSELATIKVRYKPPGGSTSLLFSRPVVDRVEPIASASESLRFGVAVAEYALAMRGAPGVDVHHLAGARSLAAGALGVDPQGERHEFISLMDRATQMKSE